MRIEFQYPVFDPPLGGVENYILECGGALVQLGHEVQVFCGPAQKCERESPFRVFRHASILPRGINLLWRPWAELSALTAAQSLSRRQPDLIVARFPTYAVASRAALPGSVPVIYLPGVDMIERLGNEACNGTWKDKVFAMLFAPLWRQIETQACTRSNRLNVLSRNMQKQMHRYGGRDAEINPAGINLVRFRPDPEIRARVRQEHQLDDSTHLVLTVGRLSPEKNISFALRLLARIPDSWHYIIAGIGDRESALRAEAQALGIADRVTLVGLVEKPEKLYAAADLLLHPAISEPFGHVLVEAMASGLPVAALASQSGRFTVATEEIVPESAGIYLDGNDLACSVAQVRELLADPARRSRMGHAGRTVAEDRFSWTRHAEALLGV